MGTIGRGKGMLPIVIWVVVPWEAPERPHWVADSMHTFLFILGMQP